MSKEEMEKGEGNAGYGDEEIDGLVAEGMKSYALRQYEEAADKFGSACEIFSTKNNSENPNLLFTYGKALFKVAVSQSGVLGDNATAGGGENAGVGSEDKDEGQQQEDGAEKQEEQEGEDGEEEEQTDFEVAWEILDTTRHLFTKQLEEQEEGEKKQEIKKNLAETYDLLGEVSLESENFPQACQDLEESLKLRLDLYPIESTLVSESYYKLSLASEFNFEDDKAREKAIQNMEKAIESVKKRVEISGQDDPDLVNDLELRLEELKNPSEEEKDEKQQALEGILGQGEVKQQLMNVLNQATDISSLVRKKRKTDEDDDDQKQKESKEESKKPKTEE
jgi:HAT1-interacting factor 1